MEPPIPGPLLAAKMVGILNFAPFCLRKTCYGRVNRAVDRRMLPLAVLVVSLSFFLFWNIFRPATPSRFSHHCRGWAARFHKALFTRLKDKSRVQNKVRVELQPLNMQVGFNANHISCTSKRCSLSPKCCRRRYDTFASYGASGAYPQSFPPNRTPIRIRKKSDSFGGPGTSPEGAPPSSQHNK
eukprot:945597-Amorphochlora_amoeboformis.AAC.1